VVIGVPDAVVARIRDDAAGRGETPAQAVRHHLLGGVIDRVARSAGGDGFVLRGGMLTRHWVAPEPRPTRDLDYVGDFAFDVDDTIRRLRPALATAPDEDDGVRIDVGAIAGRGIWLDTAFPGVHVELAIGLGAPDQTLGIDIGFHDPLVPAPATIAIDRIPTPVRACRPETMLAWKLHGIVEMGASWRPKDLSDLWLIATRVALASDDLPPAITAAFTSRGYAIADAVHAFDHPHWTTKTARLRWSTNRTRVPPLADVIADVRSRLAAALAALDIAAPATPTEARSS
jgi:hypothetical protein